MDARYGKGVVKVITVETDDSGKRTVTTVYEKTKSKKKSTKGLGSVEKVVRAAGSSLETFAEAYIGRHDESNRNKSDGWIRDFPYNLYRAGKKASEKLRLFPIPVPYADTEEEEE